LALQGSVRGADLLPLPEPPLSPPVLEQDLLGALCPTPLLAPHYSHISRLGPLFPWPHAWGKVVEKSRNTSLSLFLHFPTLSSNSVPTLPCSLASEIAPCMQFHSLLFFRVPRPGSCCRRAVYFWLRSALYFSDLRSGPSLRRKGGEWDRQRHLSDVLGFRSTAIFNSELGLI
jgi:hypothetical protein